MSVRCVYFFVRSGVHPLYREQLKVAPRGFAYLPSHPDLAEGRGMKRDIQVRGSLRDALSRRLKVAAVAAVARAGYVRRVGAEAPPGVALVHSGQYLLRSPALPYVVDFEDLHVFVLYQRDALRRPFAMRRLLSALEDERLRFLLPWSDAARQGALTTLGPDAKRLAERVITVRPAVEPRTDRTRRATSPLRVLFVGSTFFGKGGPEAIEAVRRVRESHDVVLDLVTFLPDEWRSRLGKDGAIRVHTRVQPDQLERLYAESHVLLFPGHTDTLGFVVLEAMARGLPVVASTHFALPELVEDGVSGLLVPHENSLYGPDRRPRFPWFHGTRLPRPFLEALQSPSSAYVDAIAAALARLAQDARLYERLSAGALERITSGPLSLDRRARELARVYDAAIDDVRVAEHVE